jgi:hypothetical protein
VGVAHLKKKCPQNFELEISLFGLSKFPMPKTCFLPVCEWRGGGGLETVYSLCTFPCRIQPDEILTVSPTTPIPVAGVFYAAFCSISPNFPVCPFRISCVSLFRRRIGLWKNSQNSNFWRQLEINVFTPPERAAL